MKREIERKPDANRVAMVEKAVFSELVRMIGGGVADMGNPDSDSDSKQQHNKANPAHSARNLAQGQEHVVLFVGLQGAGKTTSIMKYAQYYKKQGFRPGLVCADTFRAGALDQLKQVKKRTTRVRGSE